MHLSDLHDILNNLITMGIAGAAGWISAHVRGMIRDLNAAHQKIRRLEDEVFGEDHQP